MGSWWLRWRAIRAAHLARILDLSCLRCGCEPEVHQHFRDGDDCGRCGREVCPSYR